MDPHVFVQVCCILVVAVIYCVILVYNYRWERLHKFRLYPADWVYIIGWFIVFTSFAVRKLTKDADQKTDERWISFEKWAGIASWTWFVALVLTRISGLVRN